MIAEGLCGVCITSKSETVLFDPYLVYEKTLPSAFNSSNCDSNLIGHFLEVLSSQRSREDFFSFVMGLHVFVLISNFNSALTKLQFN